MYGRSVGAEALLALLPPEWTVADLGCGTGAVAAELAPRGPQGDRGRPVRGDAPRRPAPPRAAARTSRSHEARLEALPLADGSCDAALAVLVLSYVEDPAAVLREAARILRPGGRLVVVEAARHADEALRRRMGQRSPGFDAAALAALFPKALERLACRTVPPEPGAKGPGLVVASARRTAPRS